jgi:hypothetical protein
MSKSDKQKSKGRKSGKSKALAAIGDAHVGSCLRELDLNYQIDEDGDFRLVMRTDDDRSQICIIKSAVEEMFGIRRRKVYSPALRSFGPFDPRTADILLKENAVLKAGNWLVSADAEDTHLAIFQIVVPHDAPAALLAEVIAAVTLVADHMEQRLSGRDEF